MIALISPAKTLDFEKPVDAEATLPRFSKETNQMAERMREKSKEDLQQMMDISEDLASLNVKRFKEFSPQRNVKRAKAAGFAFQGDVYQGLEFDTLDQAAIDYAQKHLRILSGLYGLLRPLDLIQPYRLEMGTKLGFDDCRTLYAYWGNKVVRALHKDLKAQGDNMLINLASQEYFKVVDQKSLKANVIDIDFLDFSNGDYKVVSFFAKKARGMMAKYMLENRIDQVEDLKAFDAAEYAFSPRESSEKKLVFKRG